ncbi:MAG: MFS transporter [bacterium]
MIYYGWWVVLAGFLIALYVSGALFFGFTAFLEPIVAEFGWSYTQVSLVVALRGLEMGIFAPLAGYLVDKYGSRKLVLAGSLIVGLGFLLLGLTRSLFMFYGAFLLLAFGAGGCTSVVLMTAVARWFRKRIGKALGIMACGYGAGGLLIPLLVWSIDLHGWRTTLICLGLLMWFMGIPMGFLIRENPNPEADSEPRPHENQAVSHSKPLKMEQEKGFRSSFWDRSFWTLNLAEALRMMVLTAVVTHVMPYLGSMGVERSQAGLVAAALPLSSIIGRFGFGWLADIYQKRAVMMAAYGFMLVGLAAFSQAQEQWTLLLFLAFFPPGFGGTMILRGAMLREHFGVGSFGKLLGVTMGTASLGGMLGPPLAGWVFDTWGLYQPIWLALCVVMGLSILIISTVRPTA